MIRGQLSVERTKKGGSDQAFLVRACRMREAITEEAVGQQKVSVAKPLKERYVVLLKHRRRLVVCRVERKPGAGRRGEA